MTSLPHQLAPEPGHDVVTAARVEELYTSHVGLVRSVCRSLLRDRLEAEDAVQQTYLAAQRALLNGSLPRDAPAWLATIARHESLARVRARMRDPLPVDTEAEAGGPDAYAVAVTRQEVGELRDALAALPAQQRNAILMRELRGLSYEEVASELSVTPTAVRSLLFRARQSLQLHLREALASFSPGFAFRDLLTRAGGGVAAPAAAKAFAVGVSAAVITGGALVGPRVIRFGHAASHRGANSTHHRTRPGVDVISERANRRFAASRETAPEPRPARNHDGHHESASTAGGASTSDGSGDSATTVDGNDSGSGSHDRSGSDSGTTAPTSSGSGDTSTTSNGGGSGSSDGGTQTTSSGSGDTSTTSDGGGSGSSDGSSGSSGDGQPPGSGTGG